MQTTIRSLSGNGLFSYSKKLFIAITAIAFGLIILPDRTKQSALKEQTKILPNESFASIVNKMSGVKDHVVKNNAVHALDAPPDTNQLKQSDWFKTVRQDVEKRMYYIVADKKEKAYKSINGAQNLIASYDTEKITLESLPVNDKKQQAKNNWQLNLAVNGLYADDKLLQKPAQTTDVVNSNNDIEYNFGNAYTIQYHNDAKGVRQNFIIKEKPATNVHELKISLKAEGDWVVNKVHDTELHFAKKSKKGVLDNKIVYNDLKAWDANGKSLSARMEIKDNNNFEIIADASNAAYPVTIDPLSSTPSSTLNGPGIASGLGASVASAGDINGDGYSDVIVGAPVVSANTGAAYIYLGSASGLSTSAAATLNGVAAGDSFGISVAGAGDINGDGFSDVIVGAYGVSGKKGAAYIYLGSGSGIANNASPSATLNGASANDHFGISVANAGDINGDGFSDIVVGAYGVSIGTGAAYIYLGSGSGIANNASPSATLNGAAPGDDFGISVASAGDVNGDGYNDIVVGAPFHTLATGAAYIYLGSNSGIANNASPSTTLGGLAIAGGFGVSVASAGDINADGYSDIIIGAAGISTNTGAAYIYLGSVSGISNGASPSTTLGGSATNQFYGLSVSGAGDMNGDGYSDIIVGANGVSTGTGAAYVYLGTGTGIANSATAALTLSGNNVGDRFGLSVGGGGDVNGDGISDILVGAPNVSTATGAAYVYQGNPDGSISTNTIAILGTSAGDRFGLSVSTAGDINGDGYSDVIVGVIGYNGITGAAYIYTGSSTGLSTGSPSILTIPFTGSQENYGWSVAGTGDINGDGYDDVAIGAKFQDNSTGAVYLYLGSSSGIASGASPSAMLTGPAPFSDFGGTLSSAGDINGDGYYDIIVGAPNAGVNSQGIAFIYMGTPSGIASSDIPDTLYGPADFAGFGISVSGAGDVNGDGYSDVIVGAYGNNSAYVFKGSKNGIANNATADYVLTGAGNFGISVSSAGDVNGDGFTDVIVGAYVDGSGGTASVFLGSAAGLSTTAATVLNGINAGDQFGASVASAGDVNGDGYSDVIVRATLATSNSGAQTGAAYIFLGGSTGVSSTVATSFLDEGADATLEGFNFRRSVACAGDVNGDGYSDVLIGVYEDATNGFKAGNTHVYYGNNSVGHNASNVLRLYEVNLTNPIAADNLSQHNFGLGLFVQSPFGTVKGRLVWETETNGTAFQGNPITNNTVITGNQIPYTTIPAGGTEFKNLIPKAVGKATKVRVRIQYAPTGVTFGQVYSPWIYSQVYLLGGNLGVLPLNLLSFTATTSGQDILLNWKTAQEDNMQDYIVQHSLDGAKFDSIGDVGAKGNISTSSYDFTHLHPAAGLHYYRLKEVDKDGHFTFSPIVSAKINGDGIELSIYPNPASDHIVITYKGISANFVRIMNASGSVVGQYKLNNNANQTTISLKGFAKGTYFVEVVNSGFAPKQIAVQ